MSNALNKLREEMIIAFHIYANIAPDKMGKREHAWDSYCEKRESFLAANAFQAGWKYIPLKETLIDSDHHSKTN